MFDLWRDQGKRRKFLDVDTANQQPEIHRGFPYYLAPVYSSRQSSRRFDILATRVKG